MICYSCDQNNWHKVPEINPERIFQICKNCGNMAYEVDPSKEPEIKAYYRKDYRKAITEGNLLTTSRKLEYIKAFLGDDLKKLEYSNPKDQSQFNRLTVGDIGCATGYIPAFFAQRGHKVTGSEWTQNMRRFAEHYYGVLTKDEIEEKHQYDLLVMYHVFEHVMQPDKKLEYYRTLLKDDGVFLMATPEWLNILENSGGDPMGTVSHHYHKDHINVFTEKSIKRVFRKCGFDWFKQDYDTYGQTYLLKKTENRKITDDLKENWEEVKEKLLKTKEAMEALAKREYAKAQKIWPKFPEAYTREIFDTHVRKDYGRAADIFKTALDLMPNNGQVLSAYGFWLYQQQRYTEALEIYLKASKIKPNEEIFMILGMIYEAIGEYRKAIFMFNRAITINPQKWVEAQRWIVNICTRMPTWDEVAEQKIKENLFLESKSKFSLGDDLKTPTVEYDTPKEGKK